MNNDAIYSKELVNTGRQIELDIAKVFAVIFMIVVHTCDQITNMNGNILPKIIEFLGCAPSACVFMFSMGVGMIYTKHNTPKDFAIRGIKLLIMGYLLNFFRETLLVLIANMLNFENSYDSVSIISTFLMIDILQFAGVAFLITALLKKLKAKSYHILLVAIIFHTIGNLCIGIFDNTPEVLQYILGLFLFTNSEIAFPSFMWYIYPAIGICFGSILKHITNKAKLYAYVGIFSLVLLLCICAYCLRANVNIVNFFMTDEYFSQSLLTTLWCLSIVFICLSIYYFLSKIIKGKVLIVVKYVSKNVNLIYIIQWLVIAYSIALMEIIEIESFNVWVGILIGIAFIIVSIGISLLYNLIKNKMHNKKSTNDQIA